MEYDPLRRGFAEFVGTFTLIFVGAGSILAFAVLLGPILRSPQQAGIANGISLLGIAVAHGLAIGVMASAVGHISGGHFNPAITFGFLITRRLAPSLALVYWAVQLAGAVAAAALLRWFFDERTRNLVQLGTPAVGNGFGAGQALVMELILTFFLVWVVFATAADPGGAFKSIAGLAIGFTITLDILIGGPFTGAAMNPARAFGPELLQNFWTNAWVYYAGPLAGGGLAALAYEFLYLRRRPPVPVGPPETGVVEPRPGDAAVS
jgi:MIP family channel proteins